jgi:hypothetical protein
MFENADLDAILARLHELRLVPDGTQAVFVAGSVVRGWGNPTSDLDIYVIAPQEPAGGCEQSMPVFLDRSSVGVKVAFGEDRRWDVEYWRDEQVGQVLGKVSEDVIHRSEGPPFAVAELDLLDRLGYGIGLDGEAWLKSRRDELARSAVRSVLTLRALDGADAYAEDALGQLAEGDLHTAVLSAQLLLGRATDALLASKGKFAQGAKWRARQMQEAAPALLPFDEYWNLTTMRDFQPDAPGDWVRQVLELYQNLQTELEIASGQ